MTEIARIEPKSLPERLSVPTLDRELLAVRCHNALVLAGRYAVRAVSPLMWGAAIARTARGTARAASWGYGLVTARDLSDIAAKDPKYLHNQRMTRLKGAGLAAAGVAGLGVYGYMQHPWITLAASAAALSTLYAIGKSPADAPLSTVTLPDGPLVAGVSGRRVKSEVDEALSDLGVNAQVINPQPQPWGWEIPLSTRVPVASITKALPDLEVALSARPGSLIAVQSPDNASLVTLRAITGNPLGDLGEAPRYAPFSQDIGGAMHLGRQITGRDVRIRLEGTHVALVGMTGSGKSGTLMALLDYVTACHNAVAVGAELSGGAELSWWAPAMRRHAQTVEEIEDLFAWVLGVIRERCARLGTDLSDPRRTHKCTSEDPAIVFFLDEVPQIFGEAPHLVELATQIVRTGRKAGVSLVLATQRTKNDELGNSTIKDMCTIKIMHACTSEDVRQLIGPSMVSQGWAPHLLKPATKGENDNTIKNDAGRCYISAPGYDSPDLTAVFDRDDRDVVRTAQERAEARDSDGSVLSRARQLFRAQPDLPGMQADALAEALAITVEELREGMRSQGVVSGKFTLAGSQMRGYSRDAILRAK